MAAGGSALWNSLNINIDETATGLVVPPELVWTGTNANGGVTNGPLGHPAVTVGSTSLAVSEASSETTWINYEAPVDNLSLSLYGFSSVLTVPEVMETPEPASITLALVGMGVLFGARLARRRQAAARPGKCPPAHS